MSGVDAGTLETEPEKWTWKKLVVSPDDVIHTSDDEFAGANNYRVIYHSVLSSR